MINADAEERAFWTEKWGRVVDGPLAEAGVETLAQLRDWCEEVTDNRYQVVTIAGAEYLGDEYDESEWPWLLRIDRGEDGSIVGCEPVPYKGELFHSMLADLVAAGNTVVLI